MMISSVTTIVIFVVVITTRTAIIDIVVVFVIVVLVGTPPPPPLPPCSQSPSGLYRPPLDLFHLSSLKAVQDWARFSAIHCTRLIRVYHWSYCSLLPTLYSADCPGKTRAKCTGAVAVVALYLLLLIAGEDCD